MLSIIALIGGLAFAVAFIKNSLISKRDWSNWLIHKTVNPTGLLIPSEHR